MKKLILSIVLLVFACSLNAQMITVSVPVMTASPGETVNVPVTIVSGASSSGTPIGACDVNIDYDDELLTFIGLTNFYPGMPANEWIYSGNLSMVAANWIDAALLTEAIPDGTVLFDMQFTYSGGNSPLTFSKNEFYDVDYLLIPTTPINGAVNSNIVQQNVTFMVDMSREEVSSAGVHLAGSFNNWDYAANAMTDDGTGVFSVTLQLEENTTYTYRFVNGNNAGGLEDVPAECGVMNGTGEYERELSLGTEPVIMETVCFSRCENCPPLHPVTFRVDMINEEVSVNGIHLAGSFNNWNYGSDQMILTGAGAVYELTLQLEEGSYTEYKFINGNTAVDAEVVPSGCSNNGNRYVTVPSGNLVLDAFCFGECVECGSVPEFFDVTFSVDMTNETVSPEGIHIAGSFQGWQPGTTLMADQGDNIYTYTTTLLEGTSIEYLFVNGSTPAGYETVPVECSINGNRFLNSISANTMLPSVCFSACDTCQIPEVLVTFGVDMSEEGVIISPDGVHLAGSFQGWDPAATPMTGDNFSRYRVTLSLPVGTLQQFRYVNGNTAAGFEVVPSDCSDGENRYFTVPAVDTTMNMVCFASCEPCPVGVNSQATTGTEIAIVPNPSSGDSRLRFHFNDVTAVSVVICNIRGSIVFRSDLMPVPQGSHDVLLATGELQPGIYMVSVKNELSGQIVRQKFIKTQ